MAALLTVVPKTEHACGGPCDRLVTVLNGWVIDVDPLNPPCAGCLRAKPYRLPIHQQFFEGRSDWDWFRSVHSYLEFRAGLSWRPLHHSGECVTRDYRDALFVLTQAYHLKAEDEAWFRERMRAWHRAPADVVSEIEAALPPRKPPQRVVAVTKELDDAEACG